MLQAIGLLLASLLRCFRARQSLLIENLVLRQQLAVLKRKHPRPRLTVFDKGFWVLVHKFWSGWKPTLILVSPETVVRWHRSGFALYWRAISRARRVIGRKRVSKEVRELIFRVVAENPTWGAPRIHGELSMLGFELSERTVSRWMRRALRNPQPAKRWLAFLKNHREAIAAMDFFTVPTVTFRLLYCFFVTSHERRRILHFNVTRSRIRTCCTRNRNPPSPGQLHQPPCRSQARDGPRSVGRLDESCRYGGTGSPGEVSGQSCV